MQQLIIYREVQYCRRIIHFNHRSISQKVITDIAAGKNIQKKQAPDCIGPVPVLLNLITVPA